MRQDEDLWDERGPLDVRIFSDKTGTLTQNKMDFRKFSVNGVAFPDKSIIPFNIWNPTKVFY